MKTSEAEFAAWKAFDEHVKGPDKPRKKRKVGCQPCRDAKGLPWQLCPKGRELLGAVPAHVQKLMLS